MLLGIANVPFSAIILTISTVSLETITSRSGFANKIQK
jgi:hypothetical protein